jgi:nitroreductase
MRNVIPSQPSPSTADDDLQRIEHAYHHARLSANAQAWRDLALAGYGRTAAKVRATQPAPLQRDCDDASAGTPSRF